MEERGSENGSGAEVGFRRNLLKQQGGSEQEDSKPVVDGVCFGGENGGQEFHVGGGGSGGCENVGLGFGSDLILGLFGEVSGSGDGALEPLDGGGGGEGDWGLNFCGEEFGSFGTPGLFSEIGGGNGGQTSLIEGNDQGWNLISGDETLKTKKKPGRPKGSKNKKKSFGAPEGSHFLLGAPEGSQRLNGVGGGTRSGDDSVSVKKRGRPRGSKNKKKKILEGQAQEISNEIVNGKDGGDKAVTIGVVIGAREGDNGIFSTKKRRGRPKGSKSKKNIISGQENQAMGCELVAGDDVGVGTFPVLGSENVHSLIVGEEDTRKLFEATGGDLGGNENSGLKKKRGRPKGSKSKKKISVAGDGGGVGTVPILGSENVNSLTVGEDDRGKLFEMTIGEIGGNENGEPKKKRGWPKGSQSMKRIIVAGDGGFVETVRILGSENVHGNLVDGGGVETVRILGSENVHGNLVGEEDRGKVFEGTGGEVGGNENGRLIKKRSRPKGSVKKKEIIGARESIELLRDGIGRPKDRPGMPTAAEEYQGMPNEIVGSNNGIIRTALVGEQDRGIAMEANGDCRAVSNSVRPRNKRGRPKGSKNKKQNLRDGNKERDGGFYGSVRPEGLENGVTTLVDEEGRQIIFKATDGEEAKCVTAGPEDEQLSGGNEIVLSKKKRGRPKGSKTKRKCHTGEEENDRMLGRPKGSKNKRIVLFGEALKRILLQKDENQMDPAKTEEGKVKDSKKDEGFLNGDGRDVSDIETKMYKLTTNSDSVQKRSRGRPRKFCNQPENSGSIVSIFEFIISHSANVLFEHLLFTCYC